MKDKPIPANSKENSSTKRTELNQRIIERTRSIPETVRNRSANLADLLSSYNIFVKYNKRTGKYKILNREEVKENRDYESGALVFNFQMPNGIKGFYDPVSHTIGIQYNLPENQRTQAKVHESFHARGDLTETGVDAKTSAYLGRALRHFGDPKYWQGLN